MPEVMGRFESSRNGVSGTEYCIRRNIDVGQGKLNLLAYFYCYKILNNRIPKEIPQFEFFTESKLIPFICYYLKTVQCEGLFYKEFIQKHPDRTAKDNRMIAGWNFTEYMKQRSK